LVGKSKSRVIGEVSILVKEHDVDEVIIAIPSASGEVIRGILLNNLKKSQLFTDVYLQGTQKTGTGKIVMYQFTLTCKVKA